MPFTLINTLLWVGAIARRVRHVEPEIVPHTLLSRPSLPSLPSVCTTTSAIISY